MGGTSSSECEVECELERGPICRGPICRGPDMPRICLEPPQPNPTQPTMGTEFAGSAIAQNAGQLHNFDSWRPGSWGRGTGGKTKWLLIAGATNPPGEIEISTRRTRNAESGGSFLRGLTNDLATMEASEVVTKSLHNVVRNYNLKKHDARTEIKDLYDICKRDGCKPILYYTGHGQTGTGNWCFSDGTLSIQEIEEDRPDGCDYPLVISDACYSGHWANYCREENLPGFECLAAAPEFSVAYDSDTGKGGELTLWMNGVPVNRDGAKRPSTEPLYSAKARAAPYTITPGYQKSNR